MNYIDISMSEKREHFKRGMLRNIILILLDRGPKGVYEIKKAVKEMSLGFYEPSTGVIYPNLRSLKEDGLIKEIMVDGRKKYTITAEGEKYIKENFQRWKETMELKRKKFEKMKELGDMLKEITEKIVTMDDEYLERNRNKIFEILRETLEKIERV
ncbi:MAG: PadR family transcriptional regulator [Thermoplasmatales archaeon]|jgi:DNA-binding PadR family transcriptional regulator|nr:PadR family transcriptional regulator [Thermoplasmatales archaeon]